MAVPEQTPYIEHTGNGATTSFSLGFQCESKDHLIVLVDEIEPPIATWSLTGGNVVFTTAPAAGKKIKLQRNTPFGRTTNYQSFNNSFRPQTVNVDFDRIWLKLQELGVADWLMKLYVDRLHQQQEQKINDLKGYVDDRDDELRAYLLEEIRKQGVALDQLDDYYNYLMQRLAQIAVDKGWDASFVVDGDKNQHELNNIFKTSKIIDTRLYGLKVDTGEDQTAAIHAAFAANPDCKQFYIPKGTVKANVVYPQTFMYLVGDGLLSTIIEPFDLTKPAVSFNKKLYSGVYDISIQAGQDFTAAHLLDATDVRYMDLQNFDIRKTAKSGEAHKYETILIDNRPIVGSWTGYNKLRNVRGAYGAYGYLSDIDKLNSVLLMDGCVFSFNGYFNIKTSGSNATMINMDVANGGLLQPAGTYDETQYGGIYFKGDNSVILGIWHEYNAQADPVYNSNNLYIDPTGRGNITHNFARDTRSSVNVRTYTQSQGQLQDVNTADRSLNDGQGRARPQQLIQNGNFKHWNATTNRPRGWGGYFSGTFTQETADLPSGYNTGLKVVSNAAGIVGIYQTIYNPADLANSYIKDISKWVGREVSVSFWVKNIGTSETAIRGGVSTDATTVYFIRGNYTPAAKVGAWTKMIASHKITGDEPKISAGVRVGGVGEGIIVTGFSVADDCRVDDAQPKPITEDGGEIFRSLEVRGTFTNNGVQPVFPPAGASTAGLANASGPHNTTGKFVGKQVFNSTDSLMYYATGTEPTSPWQSFDSTNTITPV